MGACAYLNTFYNAEQAYDEGVRLRGASDSLSAPAREAFERAAEKSATVLERHGESKYADDALLLLARSLYELGEYGDAVLTFRQYLTRFPDENHVGAARLGLVRAHRKVGNLNAAEAALGALLRDEYDDVEAAEVVYEKARIELELGKHEAAVETFRALLEGDAEFARDHNLILEFADAELNAGEYEAALEAYTAYRDNANDPGVERSAALKIADALASAGRHPEALSTYEEVLAGGPPDSIAAEVEFERGEIFVSERRWDEAVVAYRRSAELLPGSVTASRATLHRGRIVWKVQDDRAAALDVLLDAFLHAPTSVFGDSARSEARDVARIVHYERLASGDEVVAGIEDENLRRSTALFRMAEEVLDREDDAGSAARIYALIQQRFPSTPWRPRAMLAEGLLRIRNGEVSAGRRVLHELVDTYEDTSEADSARRELGLEIPERPLDFYAPQGNLAELVSALPNPADPMVSIVDQLDRYSRRRATEAPAIQRSERPGLGTPLNQPVGGAPSTDPGQGAASEGEDTEPTGPGPDVPE